jgi:hypothetical protein
MPRTLKACCLVLLLCGLPTAARGVVVLPKGASEPVMGYLVRQDERTVVVRQDLPGGKSRDVPFSKSDLDELIITVSPERLAELDPSRPRLYREYAEELAEKQRDPEARDAAIRLYAICAARGDDKLRRGSLLGLIALARTPEEERRFRAAAYLFDSEHDESVLTSIATGDAAGTSRWQASPDLLSVLRYARQGKGPTAKAILDKPAVRTEAAEIAALITVDDLEKACSARQLTSEQLRKIVRAELTLESSAPTAAADKRAAERTTWSSARSAGRLSALPTVELEKLTEFDPAACLFRDGKWLRP